MKKRISPLLTAIILGSVFFIASITSCKKESGDDITLTASTTQALVGQKVTVTATTTANTLSWSVNPSANANQTYGVTTEKVNYYTFDTPGDYVVSAYARHMDLDSTHHCNPNDSTHHFQDSTWNHHVDSLWHHDGHHGGHHHGDDDDLATITITVSK